MKKISGLTSMPTRTPAGVLTCMPSVTWAQVTIYKVWTQICPQPWKKKLRSSYEIIRWELCQSYVWFCVEDSYRSSPRNNFYCDCSQSTIVASQNTMSAYIYFNQEQNVLICKVHQYAISSKVLYRHLLDEHYNKALGIGTMLNPG